MPGGVSKMLGSERVRTLAPNGEIARLERRYNPPVFVVEYVVGVVFFVSRLRA